MKNEKKTHVELILSKIDMLLEYNSGVENYEDCKRIIDSKSNFEKFIKEDIEDNIIKDDVEFINSKLSELLPNELKSSNK